MTDSIRHEPTTDDERWSESHYFSFVDLESKVSGFFRIGVEQNAKNSSAWCAIFRDRRVIYQRFLFNLPYSDASVRDITVADLHLSKGGARNSFKIGFEDQGGLSIDLNWRGLHDDIDMRAAMGGLSEVVGRGHTEQSGSVDGQVILDGEHIPVNGFGFRDHSWGVRDWQGVREWKTCVGTFGEHFAFHAAEINERGGQRSHLGLLFENGKIVPVDTVTVAVDDLATPHTGRLIFNRKDGTQSLVEIEYFPKAICYVPKDFNVVQECHVALRKDGEVSAGFSEINRSLRHS